MKDRIDELLGILAVPFVWIDAPRARAGTSRSVSAVPPEDLLKCPRCGRPRPYEHEGGLRCWHCDFSGGWHDFVKR